ncbi:GTP 3',8-cyclase MoaA [Leucobacter sp. Z1108]|uniref:GTP 3',8-cyclase MoaA n=1 Tax=Leucobacter sp. Z1108 TaxID=3439066 RepID=UPI003F386EA5
MSTRIQRLPALGLRDTRNRPLRDLRISVTDRCNFRCVYCMPKEIFGRDYQFLERRELLTFEEITRLASVAAQLGVEKIRLTGGEPLLRRGIETLIEMLSALRTPSGRPLDLALTTNGSALPVKAAALRAAGLNRVTVSLDSLNDAKFQQMNDVRFPVSRVLAGIDAAQQAGLHPVKVNAVIKRSVNDDEILTLARHFRGSGHILRFIEYMDVGSTNGWVLDDVVPSAEVIARIHAVYPLEPFPATSEGETAKRWRYQDGAGEIGVISSVTEAFCGNCTRARVSAEGQLFTCLFATEGVNLRDLMRTDPEGQDGDSALTQALAKTWNRRDDHYSDQRAQNAHPHSGEHKPDASGSTVKEGETAQISGRRRIEMSYIGG